MPPKSDNTKPKDTKPKGTKPESSKSEDTKAKGNKSEDTKAKGSKADNTESNPPLVLYVGFSRRDGNNPLHWILMYAPESKGEPQRCTWIHSIDSPDSNGHFNYAVRIQQNKRFDSAGIETKELIGKIDAKDEGRLLAIAGDIRAQHCQKYVTGVVTRLEDEGFLKRGKAARLHKRIEPGENVSPKPSPKPSPVGSPQGSTKGKSKTGSKSE